MDLSGTIENAKRLARLQEPLLPISLSSANPSARTIPTPTSDSATPIAQVRPTKTTSRICATLPVRVDSLESLSAIGVCSTV